MNIDLRLKKGRGFKWVLCHPHLEKARRKIEVTMFVLWVEGLDGSLNLRGLVTPRGSFEFTPNGSMLRRDDLMRRLTGTEVTI